ncbi:lytic transglycosylase domain-containing protein [Mycoavidus cysteinexigens]|nr:lytic transglycosylase domain-containing protein [Mycoavidus cysteinexigens]
MNPHNLAHSLARCALFSSECLVYSMLSCCLTLVSTVSAQAQTTPANTPLVWKRTAMPWPTLPAIQSAAHEPAKPARWQSPPRAYDALIEQIANELDLSPGLLHAVIAVESNYNAAAISPKGALGLMQVMPATARRFGFSDLHNPQANLRAGATYLKWLLNTFDNRLELAIAAYNAGEGAVRKYGGQIPPYRETQNYVRNVLLRYHDKAQQYVAPYKTTEKLPMTTQSPTPPSVATELNKLANLLLRASEPSD